LKSTKPLYGGQAVIEGVMFGGKYFTVTAVKGKNGNIEYYLLPRNQKPILQKIKHIPLLRGIAPFSLQQQPVLNIFNFLLNDMSFIWKKTWLMKLQSKKQLNGRSF
jgi:uncharacterized protein YqhQ